MLNYIVEFRSNGEPIEELFKKAFTIMRDRELDQYKNLINRDLDESDFGEAVSRISSMKAFKASEGRYSKIYRRCLREGLLGFSIIDGVFSLDRQDSQDLWSMITRDHWDYDQIRNLVLERWEYRWRKEDQDELYRLTHGDE